MRRIFVLIILAMVLIGSCSVKGATNDVQRLVGTWVSEFPSDSTRTYVFNVNGTGTASGFGNQYIDGNIFWGVSTSGELAIIYNGADVNAPVFLSPDGRIMIYRSVVYQKK